MSEGGLKSLPLVADNVRFGTLDGFDDQDGIALGMRLANSLRVNVGDSVTLVSPRGASTPFGTAPRIKRYNVAAIFELGMSEYDKTMIFMPLAEAQRYFSRPDEVDVLEVVVDDPERVGQYAEAHAGRRPARPCTSPTGASATRPSSRCSRSSATSCSSSCR